MNPELLSGQVQVHLSDLRREARGLAQPGGSRSHAARARRTLRDPLVWLLIDVGLRLVITAKPDKAALVSKATL